MSAYNVLWMFRNPLKLPMYLLAAWDLVKGLHNRNGL